MRWKNNSATHFHGKRGKKVLRNPISHENDMKKWFVKLFSRKMKGKMICRLFARKTTKKQGTKLRPCLAFVMLKHRYRERCKKNNEYSMMNNQCRNMKKRLNWSQSGYWLFNVGYFTFNAVLAENDITKQETKFRPLLSFFTQKLFLTTGKYIHILSEPSDSRIWVHPNHCRHNHLLAGFRCKQCTNRFLLLDCNANES